MVLSNWFYLEIRQGVGGNLHNPNGSPDQRVNSKFKFTKVTETSGDRNIIVKKEIHQSRTSPRWWLNIKNFIKFQISQYHISNQSCVNKKVFYLLGYVCGDHGDSVLQMLLTSVTIYICGHIYRLYSFKSWWMLIIKKILKIIN